MRLKEYISNFESKKEADRFYKKCKTGRSYAYHLANGLKRPSLVKILAMIDASDGELTLHELRPDLLGKNATGRKNIKLLEEALKKTKREIAA